MFYVIFYQLEMYFFRVLSECIFNFGFLFQKIFVLCADEVFSVSTPCLYYFMFLILTGIIFLVNETFYKVRQIFVSTFFIFCLLSGGFFAWVA